MLVIRRRAGESILIGDGIEVKVLECGPNRVKLGISAPAEIAVQRREAVLTRAQNVAAAEGVNRRGIDLLVKMLRKAQP